MVQRDEEPAVVAHPTVRILHRRARRGIVELRESARRYEQVRLSLGLEEIENAIAASPIAVFEKRHGCDRVRIQSRERFAVLIAEDSVRALLRAQPLIGCVGWCWFTRGLLCGTAACQKDDRETKDG